MGVSRQSISKWESNVVYPETDKIVRMSEMFHCTLDYLLKDNVEEYIGYEQEHSDNVTAIIRLPQIKERKSKKTLWGMPLWHVGKKARGVVAIGVNAKGIIAIGYKAQGLLSLGVLSIGLISCGTVSLGLLSLGVFAAGGLAAGCIAMGIQDIPFIKTLLDQRVPAYLSWVKNIVLNLL